MSQVDLTEESIRQIEDLLRVASMDQQRIILLKLPFENFEALRNCHQSRLIQAIFAQDRTLRDQKIVYDRFRDKKSRSQMEKLLIETLSKS